MGCVVRALVPAAFVALCASGRECPLHTNQLKSESGTEDLDNGRGTRSGCEEYVSHFLGGDFYECRDHDWIKLSPRVGYQAPHRFFVRKAFAVTTVRNHRKGFPHEEAVRRLVA